MDGGQPAAKKKRRNADTDISASAGSNAEGEQKIGRTRSGVTQKNSNNGEVGTGSKQRAVPGTKRGKKNPDESKGKAAAAKNGGGGSTQDGKPKPATRGRKKAGESSGGEASTTAPAKKPAAPRGKKKAEESESQAPAPANNGDADNGSTQTQDGNVASETKPAARGRKKEESKTGETSAATPKAEPAAPSGEKDEPESDGEPSTAPKPKSAASRGKKKAEEKESKEDTTVTITIKGAAPVDQFCPSKDTMHVYSSGDEVFDVMLNQTNVQNNNNKYYVIQLLESDTGKNYSVWQRWGRVGYNGQNNLDSYGSDLEAAKIAFGKKFRDKTGNDWNGRKKFFHWAGKYDLVDIDYTAKEVVEDKEQQREPPPPPCKLEQSVQDLLNLICDIRAMENAVKEMKYDATKSPLGKLTTAQINAGYAALKDIESCIQNQDFGTNLQNACSEFYTRIPHYFGMKTPPLIRDLEEVKQKIQLLEALSDIEAAIRTLEAGDEQLAKLHPVDRHYDAMKCQLQQLDHESEVFKMLNKYLTATHGATHRLYTMELLDAFECSKEGENEKFNDVGNRMLLWHGSRLTNWYGILSQGLRIAPPEAPVTGYMFGKGVYFADMSSKSANYCFTTREKNVGLLVLCEVALGKTRDLMQADYNADKLPDGYNSTKGVGRTQPDAGDFINMENGCVVPCGTPKDLDNLSASLQYNEYIVYDTNQIKMKYLLKVKFVY